MKKIYTVLAIAAIIFCLISAFAVGLGVTIRYAYLDQINHYHTDSCHIVTCTSTKSPTQCCTDQDDEHICYTCYNVVVNYYLDISNSTVNYTATSWQTVNYPYFCDRQKLPCYYDDRNISNTLSIQYNTNSGIIGIIILSVFLVISIIAAIVFVTVLFCCK